MTLLDVDTMTYPDVQAIRQELIDLADQAFMQRHLDAGAKIKTLPQDTIDLPQECIDAINAKFWEMI